MSKLEKLFIKMEEHDLVDLIPVDEDLPQNIEDMSSGMSVENKLKYDMIVGKFVDITSDEPISSMVSGMEPKRLNNLWSELSKEF